MTYDSLETSVDSARPVELYEFVFGSTEFFYTSSEDVVTTISNTYLPLPIKRTKLEEGPERRNVDFTITLPTTSELAQLFLGGVIRSVRVPMTVKRFHRGDTSGPGGFPELIQIFSGFVLSAKFDLLGARCALTARHALANLGRMIPARSYQSQCNHVLYEADTCKVDDTLSSNRISGDAVVSQVSTVLTVTSIVSGGYGDGDFDSGYVESLTDSDVRLVLSQVGNVLTLLTPFVTIPTSVNIFRGCGHTVASCHDDHDNVINFGGHAFVPTRNPYDTGVL